MNWGSSEQEEESGEYNLPAMKFHASLSELIMEVWKTVLKWTTKKDQSRKHCNS
jgi:hypothetical protein